MQGKEKGNGNISGENRALEYRLRYAVVLQNITAGINQLFNVLDDCENCNAFLEQASERTKNLSRGYNHTK